MNDQIAGAAKIAAAWWAARLQQGEPEQFAAVLAPKIDTALRAHGEVLLEVDYDPKGILLDALREIGVECSGTLYSASGILPQKHELLVTPDHLEPKEGYGNWTDEIPVHAAGRLTAAVIEALLDKHAELHETACKCDVYDFIILLRDELIKRRR